MSLGGGSPELVWCGSVRSRRISPGAEVVLCVARLRLAIVHCVMSWVQVVWLWSRCGETVRAGSMFLVSSSRYVRGTDVVLMYNLENC